MDDQQLRDEPIPDCPYRGLSPFSEHERFYFFGREQDVQTIGANLITAQLTLFYGASGVGKTSVLYAGVIPFVREQPDVLVLEFRSWQPPEFEQALKEKLAAQVFEKTGIRLDIAQPLDGCLIEAAARTRATTLIVFDQFEEYMLYHPASSPEAQEFDAALARAVNREDVDAANFLIAIREDALARLDRFRHAIPDLLGNRLRLDHLDAGGARRAVRKPLDHYNAVVRAHGRDDLEMIVEDELVETLIDDVRTGGVSIGAQGKGQIEIEPSERRVETPFLQMVLEKLWEVERENGSKVLRMETLRTLGGAQKVVQDHVESVMRRLSRPEREAASRIFDRLVTPSGSKIAYGKGDLTDLAGNVRDAVPALLDQLRDVRILREIEPLGSSGDTRYEIFHDVLCRAVLHWRARYQREREIAEKWKRRLRIAVPVLVVLILATILYIRAEKEKARATREIAQEQLKRAEAEKRMRMTEERLRKDLATLASLEERLGGASGQRERADLLLLRANDAQRQGYRRIAKQSYSGALEIFRELKDTVAEAKTLEKMKALQDIDTALQDEEWKEAEKRRKRRQEILGRAEGDVVPTDKTPVARCSLDTFDGPWLGEGKVWNFSLSRDRGTTVLSIRLVQGDGTFQRTDYEAPFTGSMFYYDDDKQVRMTIPLPDGKTGCQVIKGSPITFERENFGY